MSDDPKQPANISDAALSEALAAHRVPEPGPDFVEETLFRIQLVTAQRLAGERAAGDGDQTVDTLDRERPEFVDAVMERLIADPGRWRPDARAQRRSEWAPTRQDGESTLLLAADGRSRERCGRGGALFFSLLSGSGVNEDAAWPLGAADVVSRATSVAYASLEADAIASSDLSVEVPMAPLDGDPGLALAMKQVASRSQRHAGSPRRGWLLILAALCVSPSATAQNPAGAKSGEVAFVQALDENWSKPKTILALFDFVHSGVERELSYWLEEKHDERRSKIVRSFETKRSDGRVQRALFVKSRIRAGTREQEHFEILVFHPEQRDQKPKGLLLLRTTHGDQFHVGHG